MQSMFNNIDRAREVLQGKIVNTPTLELNEDDLREILPDNSEVSIKLELFQQTGSFKARGVAIGLETLEEDKKAKGIVTVRGGNHGIATAWGASQYGISAKIIMPKTADPFRIYKCKNLGAEVILAENVDDAFRRLDEIEKEENRFVLHPFNQENMIIGSATCCAEIIDQMGDIDILIIPIGGGGLIGGMAHYLDQINSSVELLGVEPIGADSFTKSLEINGAVRIHKVDTIADSLGAPMAMEFSFNIAKKRVSQVEKVTDDEIRKAMITIRERLGFIVEPACATSLAGLQERYKKKCEGKKVGIIACGSNISFDRYNEILKDYGS
jgi:threonine dehydratase